MVNTNRPAFWNKTYTRAELMEASRWFLILIGAIHLIIAYFLYRAPVVSEAQSKVIEVAAMGSGYILAGIIPSFWLRFISVHVWLFGLLYVVVVMGRTGFLSILVLIVSATFTYKMWKYRGS